MLSRRCFVALPLAAVAACGPGSPAPTTSTSADPVPPIASVPVPPPAAPDPVEPRGPSGLLPIVAATAADTIVTISVAGTPLQDPGGVAHAFADVRGIRRYMLLARVGVDRVAALNATCTHEGCTIDRFTAPLFECPCHGSQFDWTGQVRRGPAPAALPRLTADFDGRVVRIVF